MFYTSSKFSFFVGKLTAFSLNKAYV